MSPLSAHKWREISTALLDAFDRASLEQLFFYRMDKPLDRVTGDGA
jgi:hypothetical protein